MQCNDAELRAPIVARRFDIQGDFVDAKRYGSGHINDTFAITFDQAGTALRYILQRINSNVFREPAKVMENIDRVLHHIRRKLSESERDQITRRVLTLVPSQTSAFHVDEWGDYWRCYLFIEKARTYDRIETPAQARSAAGAFGNFQTLLASLPSPRLHDTIPGFHNTRKRFNDLLDVIRKDPCNRAALAREEIAFSLAGEPMVDVLLELRSRGVLPERITHNDTKLNNVMLDDVSGEGICVIDLDTVMPGLALYDFGDMCRTACRTAVEDEVDLAKVQASTTMFEALVQGYLPSAGSLLVPAEKQKLVFSAMLITLEIGIRFLADFLAGDRYFRIHHPSQNLDRARVQFQMLRSFREKEEEFTRIVNDAAAENNRGSCHLTIPEALTQRA